MGWQFKIAAIELRVAGRLFARCWILELDLRLTLATIAKSRSYHQSEPEST